MNVSGTLFFNGTDPVDGFQLWRSNGTSSGTTLVTKINAAPYAGLNPVGLANLNGTLFFGGDDGVRGPQLWRSNGNASGTTAVTDINPGEGAGFGLADAVNANGTLFFDGNDGVHGSQLWRSNGTATGTSMVSDVSPDSGGPNPFYLTDVSGTLFFMGAGGTNGAALWSSNGAAAGTTMVSGVDSRLYFLGLESLVNLNGRLFFTGFDTTNGPAVWGLHDVVPADTRTTLSASDNSPVYGETVTYTATIAAIPPGTGVPADGTVTFSFDGGTAQAADVMDGEATITQQWLATGSGHTVDATFNGDDSAGLFNASTATPLSVTIGQAATDTVIMASDSTPVFGETVTYTAQVSANGPDGGSGTPSSGTVTFSFDGGAGTNSTIDAAGDATITTTWGAAGSHTVAAVYNGDSTPDDFAASTATPFSTMVGRAATDTILTASDSSPVFGETVTYTAQVSASGSDGGSGTPSSGTVTFRFDGGAGTNATIDAAGDATTTMTWGSAGFHRITAIYNGDSIPDDFAVSTATPLTLTVGQAATTTVVTASDSSPVFGEAVTYTAQVSANGSDGGSGTPSSGTVTFRFDGGAGTNASITAGGLAMKSMVWSSIGSHTVNAQYNGDSIPKDFDPSTALQVTLTVGADTTTTTLSQPVTNVPNPGGSDTYLNRPATFTAIVRSTHGGTPTGSVTFLDGVTTLQAGVSLSAGGSGSSTATYTISTLSAGAIRFRPCTPTTRVTVRSALAHRPT